MEYRELGRTSDHVSVIGMGTYYDPAWIIKSRLLRLQSGKKEKIAALRKGLELGVNLIDTAEVYETEPLIAEAIKGFSRDKLFIATKVFRWHLKHDQVLRMAERSIKRLQCSYLDLYQIHWPNPNVPIKETLGAMEKLIDEGKVRHIGVSNFSLSLMREAESSLSKHELTSNQVEYNLKVRTIESDLLPYCNKNGIAVLAYRPIAHGQLVKPSGNLRVIFEEISRKHGRRTPAQIALNWLMCQSKVVFPIPRASSQKRVIENVGAVGWSLDTADITRFDDQSRDTGQHP